MSFCPVYSLPNFFFFFNGAGFLKNRKGLNMSLSDCTHWLMVKHSSFPCWRKHKLQPFNLLQRMPPCKVSSELILIRMCRGGGGGGGGKQAISFLNVDLNV